MSAEGHKVASLHGAKDPAERDAIIDNFRDGREKVCLFLLTSCYYSPSHLPKVLITTNVISRGIDILQVNMVVNYDLPLMYERNAGGGGQGGHLDNPDIETYIHRIGEMPRVVVSFFRPDTQYPQAGRVVSDVAEFLSTLCTTRKPGCRWSRSRKLLAGRSCESKLTTLMRWNRSVSQLTPPSVILTFCTRK